MEFMRKYKIKSIYLLIIGLTCAMFFTGCSIVDENNQEGFNEDASLIKDERVSSGWRSFQDDETGLYGFIDEKDEIVLEAQYREAWDFYGGRAVVRVDPPAGTEYNGKLAEGVYGLIDPKGDYVVEPEGIISRIDTWHYLFSEGREFWPGYGIDGNAVIKYDMIDGMGIKHGEDSFYYVLPISEQLFVVNDGNKSYFIDDDGKILEDYPTFYFPVIAKLEMGKISIVPLDDKLDRMKWRLRLDGTELEEDLKIETLSADIQYTTQIISPYIGISLFFPVFTTENLNLQSTLNASIFETMRAYQTNDALMGIDIPVNDNDQIDHIDYSMEIEYDVSLIGNLINYDVLGYWYGFGAAHPNSIWKTNYYDAITGSELKLEALFDAGKDWRRAIAELVDARFLADETAFLFIDKNTPKEKRISEFENADFCITFSEDIMRVYYSQYEIAPYSSWFPTYEINYADISDYFDGNGALYKALFN